MPPQTLDPHISAEERAQALELLDESHRKFAWAISSVSDAQWTWKPAPREWSVGETAEHIVLAEALLFSFVSKAVGATPPRPGRSKRRARQNSSSSGCRQAKVTPCRQTPSCRAPASQRAQARERFEQQRLHIVTFARETQMALKAHTIPHPFPIFGTLNAYQWLIFGPLHTIHHDKQIANVKATPGYPS